MSDDEKPSESKLPVRQADSGTDTAAEPTKSRKHKVIADIHSGMVLVAPIATTEDVQEEEPVQEEKPVQEEELWDSSPRRAPSSAPESPREPLN